MTKEKSLQELFAPWGDEAPKFFAEGSDFVPVERLTPATPEHIGYPGPRARLPVPADFSEIRLENDAIINATRSRGLSKIVIAYPTSYEHLKARRSHTKFDDKLHQHELRRLGIELGKQADALIQKAKDNNLSVEFLPMAKLTEHRSMSHVSKFGDIAPIRFWTATKPPQDAVYVLFDDVVAKGATIAGMLSLLTNQNIPADNILGIVTGFIIPNSKGIRLSEKQTQAIDTLYKEHPGTAKRADIILDLIGIGGLKALTPKEYDNMFMLDPHLPHDEVDDTLKLLYKDIKTYESIPEPTQCYVKKMRDVGLPIERSRF